MKDSGMMGSKFLYRRKARRGRATSSCTSRRSSRSSDDQATLAPLCLMLSQDTEAATRALLAENNNFGMRPTRYRSSCRRACLLYLTRSSFRLDNNEILCKPHGHGDVHSLLAQSGLPKEWLNRGLKRVFFFKDTNAFALRTTYSSPW